MGGGGGGPLYVCVCVYVCTLRIVSMDKIVNPVHLFEYCRPQNLCQLHWIKLSIVKMLVCVGVGWGASVCVCVCERVHVLTLNRLYGQDCEPSAFD